MGVVLGALAIAGLATVALRSRAQSGRRRILSDTGLPPGTYLFTSAACADCLGARTTLDNSVGPSGYTEMSWEEQPGLFGQLGVDGVPATLVVDDEGNGVLAPGTP